MACSSRGGRCPLAVHRGTWQRLPGNAWVRPADFLGTSTQPDSHICIPIGDHIEAPATVPSTGNSHGPRSLPRGALPGGGRADAPRRASACHPFRWCVHSVRQPAESGLDAASEAAAVGGFALVASCMLRAPLRPCPSGSIRATAMAMALIWGLPRDATQQPPCRSVSDANSYPDLRRSGVAADARRAMPASRPGVLSTVGGSTGYSRASARCAGSGFTTVTGCIVTYRYTSFATQQRNT